MQTRWKMSEFVTYVFASSLVYLVILISIAKCVAYIIPVNYIVYNNTMLNYYVILFVVFVQNILLFIKCLAI